MIISEQQEKKKLKMGKQGFVVYYSVQVYAYASLQFTYWSQKV